MRKQNMTDAYKNAIGTVFLLAGAFFICSTLLSMRTVLADPIAPTTVTSGVSPARAAARSTTNTRSTVARTTAPRTTSVSRTTATADRNVRTRSVSVRSVNKNTQNTLGRSNASRSVASRTVENKNVSTRSNSGSRSTKRIVARTATTPSRVSLVGTGIRASTSSAINVSYLTSKLYTGNYSNIIDSTTGMISAEAYSTCLESYYTCMDEICTARSDTKGRCSCAGRATNFLDAEAALEKANEELISLSGQLALLISTKGKDVSEAFKLTDAEKVMNCVSWNDMKNKYGTNSDEAQNWCAAHGFYDGAGNGVNPCEQPKYCADDGIVKGFKLSDLNGSSSDILASLQAWADAKDLAKQYTDTNTNTLLSQYTNISSVVNGLTGVTSTTVEQAQAELDKLANKWGYELFEYAHNNVCGRVLDTCFNGIYEACGTPPPGADSAGNKIGKCANGASTSCPYNYNSAISVNSKGDVELNERGSTGSTTSTTATCFGYTSTSGDPYASLRGPVADARRSIMQKYLLDANAACDTYGTALKNTAQNINYQKIAAEQALRQKRLDFYNEEEQKIESDAITAVTNFNECISEIWDCYNENADAENWSTARIKTYCAQVSNVPHCYEPMICNLATVQFKKVIDDKDTDNCKFSVNRDENTCRNVVTLNEILYGAASGVATTNIDAILNGSYTKKSAEIREACLLKALGCGDPNPGDNDDTQGCLRKFKKPATTSD